MSSYTEEQLLAIKEYLLGNTELLPEFEMVEKYGGSVEEIENEMFEYSVERCNNCGYWCEVSEIKYNGDDSRCENCASEDELEDFEESD